MYAVIARWFKLGGVALNAAPNSYALVLLACIACLVFPRVADACYASRRMAVMQGTTRLKEPRLSLA